jgi:tripartite-type tricarboxylate transporter receptor subunit TctC
MNTIRALFALLPMLFAAGAATAQTTFPDRPVHMLVGYIPGGPNDIIARAVGDRLAALWGKGVIIDNVPGASANIAGDRVAKATPDGYTLLLANMNQIVVNPSLFEHMSFDPVNDLAPISLVAMTPNVLTVPNELPVHSVQELVAFVRATPGKYTFGHPGVGTAQHLACELFKSMAKIDIQGVPYRGAAAVITDILGNRLTLYCGNVAPLTPLVREGKLRGLAVTSRERFAALQELPTVAESGFPGYDVTATFPLMTTAGTPAVVIRGTTPAELAAAIRSELAIWPKLIKEAGLRATE